MKMIPAAPISARGPLGLVQLPRLWSKVMLNKKGLLQDGYKACGDGFDKVVLDGLGLEREQVIRYIEEQMPTYFAFEKWVVEKKGGSISPKTVEEINERILSRQYPDPKRVDDRRRDFGVPEWDTKTSIADLNEYDDWMEFHAIMTGSQSS